MQKNFVQLTFCCLLIHISLNTKNQLISPAPQASIRDRMTTTEHKTISRQNTKSSQQTVKQRSICVKNNITDKMISYTKCFVSYKPDFSLQINGKKIEPNSEQTIPVEDDKLTISYHYNFMKGYKKGAKAVEFEVSPDTDELEVTFSWNDDVRVILPNAKPININELS